MYKGVIFMKFCKNILSFITAGTLALSAVPFASLTAFAAEKDKTFDGLHDLSDTVGEYSWGIHSNSEDPDEYEKLLKSAFGSNLSRVTYRTLAGRTSLNLSGAGLTSLPDDIIMYMTGLTTLNLSDNYLTNEDVRDLDADHLTKLRTIDLSHNFLTSIPSWVVSSDASTKRLSENFIRGYDPRTIKVLNETYYFSDGDSIDLDELEEEIIDSVRFGDDSEIPGVWLDEFDEEILTVDFDNFKKLAGLSDDNEDTIVYTSSDSTIVDIPVYLGNFADTAVQVYLMNGTDLSSVKMLLGSLINENVNAAAYTDNSKKNYENAKKVAQAVYNSGTSDFDIYKNAFDQLNRARRRLEEVAGTELMNAVKAYIDDSKNYPEANYTSKSYADFKSALDGLNALQKDSKNATIPQAETAIKRFQSAIAGLVSTSLKVPDKAPKSDFESIYGLNSSKSYEGTAQNGLKYKWTFSGKDITAPAEFNPEVKDTDSAEPDIMVDAGSAGSYLLFSTAQTGALPGKASLTLSPAPSGFADGKYYLYKWDSSAKKGVPVGEANLANNTFTTSLSEGGVYYIYKTLKNLVMASDEFNVDDAAKRVVVPLSEGYTAAEFKNRLTFGNYSEVRNKNGSVVSNSSRVTTGMTVNVTGGQRYTVVVMGDSNLDGIIDVLDVSQIIKMSVGYDSPENSEMCSDINSDGIIDVLDASALLKFIVS